MWHSTYAPPFHKLQRWMGMQPRLPHYVPFWREAVEAGLWFAVVWCALMWMWEWRAAGMAFRDAVTSSAIAGVFFGLALACGYAWGRRKWTLSRWDVL